jgi:hypothetical protein
MNTTPRRPGDDILDRYCPGLSPEDREEARERLRRLARIVIRIAKRLEAAGAIPTSDSPELESHCTIPSLPQDI